MPKKVLVPLADGFEEIEAVTIIDVLRRAGAEVTVAGLHERSVTGSHGIEITTDCLLGDVADRTFDMVALPGGMPGSRNLNADKRLRELLARHYAEQKFVAAICAAPMVLASIGILSGKRFTIHPSQIATVSGKSTGNAVERDGTVITGQAAGAALPFALQLVEALYDSVKVSGINQSLLAVI